MPVVSAENPAFRDWSEALSRAMYLPCAPSEAWRERMAKHVRCYLAWPGALHCCSERPFTSWNRSPAVAIQEGIEPALVDLTRSGVDILTVKDLLGHANISTTLRYAHSNDEAKRRAGEKLNTSDKVVTVVPRRAKRQIWYSDIDRK